MLSWLERTRDRVLGHAAMRDGDTVADVGAGTGLLTIAAAERLGASGDVLAIDVSVDALEELRRVCTSANVAYLIGSAEVLPLMDAAVDVVVTRSVLIYVRAKDEAAAEFYRVLRPSGRVALYEPLNRRATRMWDVVDFGKLTERVVEEFDREWPRNDPMLDFDEDDLAALFAAAGFSAINVEAHDVVHEISAEKMLFGRSAPGRRPLAERWAETFSREEALDLERRLREAGTVRTAVPGMLLSAVKS
jgi:ubiquinone/menaquinone biosynthesis C-methylase UbiE